MGWVISILLAMLVAVWLVAQYRPGRSDGMARAMAAGAPVAPAAPSSTPLPPPAPRAASQHVRAGAKAVAASAACLAARTREEQRTRPTEVEREAQRLQSEAAHARITQALEACEALNDSAFDDCMVANGADRGASSPEERAEFTQLQTALRAQAWRMAARSEARSLLAAALVMPNTEDPDSGELTVQRAPEAMRWLVEAQRRGHSDALVQWSLARIEASAERGDSPALLAAVLDARRRLPMLEPDNAAAFLVSVRADRPPNATLTPDDLARAAEMSTYRVPMAAQVTLLLDAMHDLPVYVGLREQAPRRNPDHEAAAACASDEDLLAELRMLLAIGPVFASTPDPAGLSEACTIDSTASSAPMRAHCLRLFERMHEGASLMEQSLAAVFARKLAAPGPARAQWEERHRRYLWRQWQLMQVLPAFDTYEMARIDEQAWRSGSEDLAIDEMLTRAGIATEPPADWQPPIGP